ncbi:hypothetical protein ACFE04_027491 [Oxalis oulophora]
MNRSRSILNSIRTLNRLLSPGVVTTRPVLTQVTQFSPPSLSHCPSYYAHQNRSFSSKPNSLVDLISTQKWSTELEAELEKSTQHLTHETVIYVLKTLDKDPHKAWDFFNWVCGKPQLGVSSQQLYCLMLRILAVNDIMNHFWITASKMGDQGFCIDKDNFVTISPMFKGKKVADVLAFKALYNSMIKKNDTDKVLKQLVDVVWGAEWSDKVVEQLNAMKIKFSDTFVVMALKGMGHCPLKALKFFSWVGQRSDYKHSSITYNALLRILAKKESIEEFWSFVEEMKKTPHKIDIDTYVKLSRQFQRSKMLEDAVKLYEVMMDGPYKPSDQNCNLILRSIAATDNPDLNLVFRVSKKYEESGNSLSKAAYDGIHRSLTRAGRFEEAENILKAMQNAGYEPDNITYSQLVFGLCKEKRLEEASKVLDEMEDNGCSPDIKTWTILIQGYCLASRIEEALMCFAKMMERNFHPDADLLDVLIDGFVNQNKIDGAYKLLVELVGTGQVKPWQATFKMLIERLLQENKLQEAMNLLNMMKRENYPPYPEPFVQYIGRFGSVEDASAFLKALSVKEYPSSPAYLHLFKSFFSEGRHFEARDLLYKCPHHIRKDTKICELFGSAKS